MCEEKQDEKREPQDVVIDAKAEVNANVENKVGACYTINASSIASGEGGG